MEWLGFISLILILCYSSFPAKLKKLERRVKKNERNQNRGVNMSKIITDLLGKECRIKTDEVVLFSGSSEILCKVVDVDDEWIKITYSDKKGTKTRIFKIDTIEQVELINE